MNTLLLTPVGTEGIIITVVGILIVFTALFILATIFSILPAIINYKTRKELRRQGKISQADTEEDLNVSGETNAAIAMALHMYFEDQHDVESDIITIKKIAKRYSPWSSKIYSMNSYFNKK